MHTGPLMPIAIGLAASAVVVARLVTWMAVGTWFTRAETGPVGVLLEIVVASAVTACCYGVFALAGRLGLGLGLDAGIGATAILMNRALVARQIRELRDRAVDLLGSGRKTRSLVLGWLALAWLTATAPPRDADVLRYHLAHVRQIALEGQWAKIVDTAYALPFGWSLTYLPFELIHLGVAAQMLNLGVWIATILALHGVLRQRGSEPLRLLMFGLACQPLVFRAVTTAHVDTYVMLLMTAVVLLIDRGPALTIREATLLGFASWVGLQSRYQAAAIGLAVSITVVALVVRGGLSMRTVAGLAAGAVLAGLLAAPFYLANLRWFGDPLWPFLAPSGVASAANRVAQLFTQRTAAPLEIGLLPLGLYRLAIDITVFPIPWIAAAALVAGWRLPRTRIVAAFTTCYLVLWALVEPVLFPRFILFLVPVIPLLAADGLTRLAHGGDRVRHWTVGVLATYCAAGAFLVVATNASSVRYALTGDRERYERSTWFAPVFRWANETTPRTTRFLVIVKSGGTYALERPYRRADPEGSGEIDWTALGDGHALVDELQARGFDMVIYEDRDWSAYPGGPEMVRIVRDAISHRLLVPVETFSLQLMTSRLFGHTVPTTVRVFRVAPSADAVADRER